MPMSSVRASVRAHVRVASGGSSRTTQEGYIQSRMRVIFECVLAKEQMSVAKNTRKRAKKSFYFVCYCIEAESDREKHSVFFATHPTQSPPNRPSSHNNPIVVHRTPIVRAVVLFRQDRWWRCL